MFLYLKLRDMKAGTRSSAFAKTMGNLLSILLLLVLSTSFLNAPADGYIEKPFSLENFAKATVELTVEQPGDIVATAEWNPKKAELALILFGPGQMNYYRRSDGKSPLELTFTVTAQDTAEGSAWRLKLVNQSGESVEGMLRISFPEGRPAAGEVLQ